LETAFIGDGWIDAVDPSALHDVLSATSFGWAWQVEGVAVLLLLASLVTARRRPRAIAVTSGLVLASVSLTGHAVMQAGWLGIAHRVNDALHVVCAGAWLGGLVPLVAVIAALGDSDHEPDAELALRRFSTAGLIVVPLIIASGIINTALVLGRWPTDWSSPYRSLLALKIVLAATMIGIATANRYQFVQRLAQHGPAGHRALRTGAVVEIVLGLCVVALVSVFGMLDPNDIS
jgi:putative copper resistance protein D